VELNPEIRIEFVIWQDELVASFVNSGNTFATSAANQYQSVGFDGTTNEDGAVFFYGSGATSTVNMTLPYSGIKDSLPEGHHYVTLLGGYQQEQVNGATLLCSQFFCAALDNTIQTRL
jgi:hypothetical protein